MSKLANILVDY